jgi:uncharacterized protein YjbJ (UPF0337 family)
MGTPAHGSAFLCHEFLNSGEIGMDKNRIEGAADKAKGAVKEGIGKAVGNDRLQAEGAGDKAKGAIKEGAGKAADAVRDGVNKVSDNISDS